MCDRISLLDTCGLRAPLIAQVERRAGWARLWDAALDYGVSHTRWLHAVVEHRGVELIFHLTHAAVQSPYWMQVLRSQIFVFKDHIPLVSEVTVPVQVSKPPVIHPRGPHSTGRNSQMKRLEALILLNPSSPPCHPLTWILAGKALGQILAIFVWSYAFFQSGNNSDQAVP